MRKTNPKRKAMPESWNFMCGNKPCVPSDYVLTPLGFITIFFSIPFCASLLHNINFFNTCNPVPFYGTCALGALMGLGWMIYGLLNWNKKWLLIFSILIGILLMAWNIIMWTLKPCPKNQNVKVTRALAWFNLAMMLVTFGIVMKS